MAAAGHAYGMARAAPGIILPHTISVCRVGGHWQAGENR